MKFLSARRRNPFVAVLLLVAALGAVGITFSTVSNIQPAQAALGTQTQVEEGKKLYLRSSHGYLLLVFLQVFTSPNYLQMMIAYCLY